MASFSGALPPTSPMSMLISSLTSRHIQHPSPAASKLPTKTNAFLQSKTLTLTRDNDQSNKPVFNNWLVNNTTRTLNITDLTLVNMTDIPPELAQFSNVAKLTFINCTFKSLPNVVTRLNKLMQLIFKNTPATLSTNQIDSFKALTRIDYKGTVCQWPVDVSEKALERDISVYGIVTIANSLLETFNTAGKQTVLQGTLAPLQHKPIPGCTAADLIKILDQNAAAYKKALLTDSAV